MAIHICRCDFQIENPKDSDNFICGKYMGGEVVFSGLTKSIDKDKGGWEGASFVPKEDHPEYLRLLKEAIGDDDYILFI